MSLSLADFSGDLQAAVAALPPSGGKVIVREGAWMLPGAVRLDLSRDKLAVEKCNWNDIPKESRCFAASGLIFASGQGP